MCEASRLERADVGRTTRGPERGELNPLRMCFRWNLPTSRVSGCACIDLSGRMLRVAKEPFVFCAVVGELFPY